MGGNEGTEHHPLAAGKLRGGAKYFHGHCTETGQPPVAHARPLQAMRL